MFDGVYYIYTDNTYEFYCEQSPSKEVKYIGVKQGDRSIAISLKDLVNDAVPLIKENSCMPKVQEKSDFYIFDDWKGPFEDFKGKQRTDYLRENGCLIVSIDENEHLPSVGEFVLICGHLSRVEEAIAYSDGEEIMGKYWTSSFLDKGRVWYIHPFIGRLFTTNEENDAMTNFAHIRTVTKFL